MKSARFTFVIALIMQVLGWSNCSATQPPAEDHAKYRVAVFSGAASKEQFNGRLSPEVLSQWFKQDYDVGGERVETPLDAKHFGVMVLQLREDLILMPLCAWTTDGGDKYFACQSGSIGNAPKFSVCIECETADDFLEHMRAKLVGLPKKDLAIDKRAEVAVAEIKRMREVTKAGSRSKKVKQQLGEPNSITKFDSGKIAETWRYDIDETVYILVNYDSNFLVIGSGSSGIKELIGSED